MIVGSALAIMLASAAPVAVPAAQVPPITERMLGRSALLCFRVALTGRVTGVFLLESSGDADADLDILAWAAKLYWPAASEGETGRGDWLPMRAAFGDGAPERKVPATCAPPTPSDVRS